MDSGEDQSIKPGVGGVEDGSQKEKNNQAQADVSFSSEEDDCSWEEDGDERRSTCQGY